MKRWRFVKCYLITSGEWISPTHHRGTAHCQYIGVLEDGRAFYGNGADPEEARRNLRKASGFRVPVVEPIIKHTQGGITVV